MRKFDKKMQALQWPAHFFCYVTVKLPSCPIVGRDFEFRFFLDAEASCADPQVAEMINELSETCPEFVFLGNYAEA